MQIQGISSYKPVPKAQFADENGESIPNREKTFSTQKSVVPTSEEWERMKDDDKWFRKLSPIVRSTNIAPLLWGKTDEDKKVLRQLEMAMAAVQELNTRHYEETIAAHEATGKELRQQARSALDLLPGLQERLGNSQSILFKASSEINKQAVKLDEIRSQKPPDNSYPTEAEISKWAKRVEAAEAKLIQLQGEYAEDSQAASLLKIKRDNANYDLREAERGIMVNLQRLNQLKRLAGIPVSEGKANSYSVRNEFGLS